MKPLSLGDIAKLAGYSRARIHQFAVEGKIPFKAIKQPPEGQFRYEDTRGLRVWCRAKRKSKPKAQPRGLRRPDTRSVSARVRRAIKEMVSVLESGRAEASDIQNAISLLNVCGPLAFAPLRDNQPQPCTKGALATLAHYLLSWTQFDAPRFIEAHEIFNRLHRDLDKALRVMPKSPRPSPIAPA